MKKEKVKKNKKKKVITILIIVFAIIAIILVVGYIALNMAFSMLTESLYDIPPATVTEQQEEVELSENKGAETLPPDESVASTETNSANGMVQKDTKAPAKKDALTRTQEKYGIDSSMNFTPEKVKKFEKAISLTDKLSMMAVISGSLSQSDFQKVLALTGGGVTREEVNQALMILKKGLGPKEKSEIYKYYKKYAHLLEE